MDMTIPINELEKRMRPGAYSSVGFLGSVESLEAVLHQDNLALQNLKITHDQLSTRLEKLLIRVLEQRDKLLQTNYQEYREREYHSISWHNQPAVIFSIANLPSTNIGFILEKYQVFFIQTRGLQECPWDCKWDNNWSSFDFLLLNREIGEYATAPGLIVHLIREHHFFEGLESPYRVEPLKLAQVLGLVS